MLIDQRGSEVLPRPECARLLALHSGGVGRLGMVVEDQPAVVPLGYTLVDGYVVVRIGAGTILATIRSGTAIVAFEFDHTPADRRSYWWSVLLQGHAEEITDPALLARLRPVMPAPAVPEPGGRLVRIHPDVLSGRRFFPRALA